MKNNMNYKRFRHFGKDKVFMDFAFFAIAFNIKKKVHRVLRHTLLFFREPISHLIHNQDFVDLGY